LKKLEKEVEEDARKGVRNITEWLGSVFTPQKNPHGVKYAKLIGVE
jgi:hypothetical protein